MEVTSTRYLYDMKSVLYDQEWLKTAENAELYHVWRNVEKTDNLRYDITLIPAKMMGREFVKTKGHKHKERWFELIEVLEGKAFYFFQKGNKIIEDCYVIKANKGDFVIADPDYNHLTINPSKEDLKMANWVYEECKNDYNLFEKMQGACYYYLDSGWVKNNNYQQIPELRFLKPLKEKPISLEFLKSLKQ